MVNISTSRPLPGSPTRSSADAFLWWRSLLFALALIAAGVVLPIFVAAFLLVGHALTKSDLTSPATALGLQLVSYAFVLVVCLAYLPRLARSSLADLGLRLPNASEVGWGLAGAVAMLIAVDLVGSLEERLFHTKITETAIDLLKATRGTLLTTLFVTFACVIAPFFEELQFRGFLYNALRRYLPTAWAAMLSGLVFGAAHFSALAIVPLACGGVVLALVYERTRSLAATTIAHGLFNAAGVTALLVFHQA